MKKRLTPEEFISLARSLPQDERTPYAFEHRIMARLQRLPSDGFAEWTHALWRAMAPCVGIMLLVAMVSLAAMAGDPVATEADADLESIVFAPTQIAFDVSR